MIEIEQKTSDTDPMVFNVSLSDSAGRTHHRVTMDQSTYLRLTAGNITPVACIDAAFRFLLEREAKTDIMASFDLNVLQLSFSSFERELRNYF